MVRQAISKVIDRDTLVERVLGGYGEPGTTIVPPFAEQWHTPPTSDTQAYDPAGAATMLEEAGYVDTDGEPGFFDSLPHLAPAMFEVSYHVTGALDVPERRLHERALVGVYRALAR